MPFLLDFYYNYFGKDKTSYLIYICKISGALLNIVSITIIFKFWAEVDAIYYVQANSVIMLSSIFLSFGIDQLIERFYISLISSYKKEVIWFYFVVLNLFKILCFTVIIFSFPDFVSSDGLQPLLIVSVFGCFVIFNSSCALLNAIERYLLSSLYIFLKALGRVSATLFLLGSPDLNMLFVAEITVSVLCLFPMLASILLSKKVSSQRLEDARSDIFQFAVFGYATRSLLHVFSLNSLRLILLQDNNSNLAVYLYILQLLEAGTRFVPNIVLGGKFRNLFGTKFDESNLTFIEIFNVVIVKTTFVVALQMVCLFLFIMFAVSYVHKVELSQYYIFVFIGTFFLLADNLKSGLNVISNVLKANGIQLCTSLVMAMLCIFLYLNLGQYTVLEITKNYLIITSTYFIFWALFAIIHSRLQPNKWKFVKRNKFT